MVGPKLYQINKMYKYKQMKYTEYESQLSAGIILEKATAAFKLNAAWSFKSKMYNRLSTSLYCSSPAKCCSGAQSASSDVGTIMENITKTYGSLFQQMERLIWFHTLKFLEKKDSVLQFIQSNLKPSGKRTLCVPPSLLEICLFQTLLPLGISATLHRVGMYFFRMAWE